MTTIKDTIDYIVSKKEGFLTIEQNKQIISLINSNEEDMFFWELEKLKAQFPDLDSVLEEAEMYHGFNEKEVKEFLKRVNNVGFTFDYVDVATQNNGQFNHTVKVYNLRRK